MLSCSLELMNYIIVLSINDSNSKEALSFPFSHTFRFSLPQNVSSVYTSHINIVISFFLLTFPALTLHFVYLFNFRLFFRFFSPLFFATDFFYCAVEAKRKRSVFFMPPTNLMKLVLCHAMLENNTKKLIATSHHTHNHFCVQEGKAVAGAK